MKFINWIVRFKHPMFWIGLVALFFATIGVDASSLTSWALLVECITDFINNPFAIGSVVVAFIGYVTDFTTEGLSDTDLAMSYSKPRCEQETEPDEVYVEEVE